MTRPDCHIRIRTTTFIDIAVHESEEKGLLRICKRTKCTVVAKINKEFLGCSVTRHKILEQK